MKFYHIGFIALGLASAMVWTGCNKGTESAALDSATVKVDLKNMAANVTRFSGPNEQRNIESVKSKNGLAKRAVGNCAMDSVTIENYQDTVDGLITSTFDTTRSYTKTNSLVCDEGDSSAYQISNQYSKNSQMETWAKVRLEFVIKFDPGFSLIDTSKFTFDTNGINDSIFGSLGSDLNPPDTNPQFSFDFSFKVSGSGRVHYASGYDLTINSMSLKGDTSGIVEYKMELGLESGKYIASLSLAPGVDLMSDVEPAAKTVVASGPITSGGTVVGYFELLGDDTVVIRDINKAIVSTKG